FLLLEVVEDIALAHEAAPGENGGVDAPLINQRAGLARDGQIAVVARGVTSAFSHTRRGRGIGGPRLPLAPADDRADRNVGTRAVQLAQVSAVSASISSTAFEVSM